MNRGFVVALLAVLLWYAGTRQKTPPTPPPPVPVKPTPTPEPKPKPKPRPKPCPGPGPCPADDAEASSTVGGPEHNGKTVNCDLPKELHLKNKGGSDGAGLCVFTSLDMAAQWSNVPEIIGFRDYMTKFPGGGYPEKVSKYIKKLSTERGHELVEGRDWGQFTDADDYKLDKILTTGRMAGITYGYSPRYGSNVAHMVDLVMIDNDTAAILDNNFPGTIEWMDRKEFVRRWKIMGGGWGVWFNAPPPPPVPVNR